MGMLETRIKKVPEGMSSNDAIKRINRDLEEYFDQQDNSCDGYDVDLLREHNFDEIWEVQETYKNTPEIKEKYRNLAKEGKLIYIEIDY
jgi:hypothetical protein